MQDLEPHQQAIFLVQDNLFRVWGKVSVENINSSVCEGSFQALPDFQFLKGRFAEYQALIESSQQGFFEIAALNDWMVKLAPKLVATSGTEIPLICAFVRTDTHGNDLQFYGVKLDHDDAALLAAELW